MWSTLESDTSVGKFGRFWRVEEEFVNAVRGLEAVSHTDFATGVAYMEFTDAVAHSLQSGESVHLPLAARG